MTKLYLHEFGPDLPGVKGGKLKGPMASTITAFAKALRQYRVCTDAGLHGSVIVWRDDAGKWRCQFCVYQRPRDEQVFDTKKQVVTWLKQWMPKQHVAA